MRGDILLFLAKPGNFQDWMISRVTDGKFTHVEVDMGNGRSIGETGFGLQEHGAPGDRQIVRVNILDKVPEAKVPAGMAWVESEGKAALKAGARSYGFKDIFNDGMKFLHLPFKIPPEDNEMDCSNFTTQYLIHADAAGPLGDLAKDPSTVSPNDLARAFGVPTT